MERDRVRMCPFVAETTRQSIVKLNLALAPNSMKSASALIELQNQIV